MATTWYSVSGMTRGLVLATMVAGTLDLLAAFAFSVLGGGTPAGVLISVASGPIGPAAYAQPIEAMLLGLLLHFLIMGTIASLYAVVVMHAPLLNRLAPLSGIALGLAVWAVMYRVVLPLRWPDIFPLLGAGDVAREVFSHVLLVGIPIALILRAASRWEPESFENDTQ